MKFTVVLSPEPDSGYSIICPALPGCASEGDSLEEAIANITEAVLGWLEVQRDRGMQTPAETPAIVAAGIENVLRDRAEDGYPLTIETREIEVSLEVPV